MYAIQHCLYKIYSQLVHVRRREGGLIPDWMTAAIDQVVSRGDRYRYAGLCSIFFHQFVCLQWAAAAGRTNTVQVYKNSLGGGFEQQAG